MTHVKRLFLFALVLGASHVEIRSSQLVLMDQLASEYKQLRQQVKGLKDKNSILGGFIVAGNLDGVSERNLQEGISRMQRVVAENGVVTTSEPTEPLMDPGLSLSAKNKKERAERLESANKLELEELFKRYGINIQSILLNPDVSVDFKTELSKVLHRNGIDLTVEANTLSTETLERQVKVMEGFANLSKNPTLDMLKKDHGPVADQMEEIVRTTEANIQNYNPQGASSKVDFVLQEIAHVVEVVVSGQDKIKEEYKGTSGYNGLFGFRTRIAEREILEHADSALEALKLKANELFKDEELATVLTAIETARDDLSLVPTTVSVILETKREDLYDYTVSDLHKMKEILKTALNSLPKEASSSLPPKEKVRRINIRAQIEAIDTLLKKVKGKGFGSSEYSVGELLRLHLIQDLSENTQDLLGILKKDKIHVVTQNMLEGIHGQLKQVVDGFVKSEMHKYYIQGYLQGLLLANGITSASYVTKLDARKVDKLLRLLKQVSSKTVAARS